MAAVGRRSKVHRPCPCDHTDPGIWVQCLICWLQGPCSRDLGTMGHDTCKKMQLKFIFNEQMKLHQGKLVTGTLRFEVSGPYSWDRGRAWGGGHGALLGGGCGEGVAGWGSWR